ncbi:MAG: indolepyruvate ferredoxin oxidoreductase family protein [Aquidulcibacter sp.]|jgi:indolepyruvate ferredoxin oxidoreductase|uniref:indolepyruvate ferredoxin oxidoreductase family protein n=1 Tax=Aquidulcibacter sp. TaxID=2052990 RepID=UPI0022C9E540|nr:indolepyruvate ferredoxin oxidoreductase family protein [Aquidulcibacter sp.]
MLHREVLLTDKYELNEGRAFLTGIQALVRLPLDQKRRDVKAGLNTAGFISGYRGSPLGGYDMQLERASKLLKSNDIEFWPGLNEDLGATAVWGSQQLGQFAGARFDGVFGIWYGKAPGVDRTGDVFKHANFAGTSKFGGTLAIAGDDHVCKSSTLPSQSEFAFIDAEMPILSPASIQDVLDFGLYGFALSRFSGAWTGLIALADTMDSGAVIDVGAHRFDIRLPTDFDLPPEGLSLRRGDDPMAKEARLRQYKLPAAQAFVRANGLDREILAGPKRRIGLVATGQATRDIFEALDALGVSPELAGDLGLAIYKVAMPWPLEPYQLRGFALGLETLLVVEHKRALIEPQIRDALYDLPDGKRPRVIGKKGLDGAPLLPDTASISIPVLAKTLFDLVPEGPHREQALAYLNRVQESKDRAKALEGDAHRTPHFCSGCPHNSSTVVPEGSRALAGIGCHYMATFMPERQTDMTSQMGGEGIGWIGQAPFTEEDHVFVNLGDGTYSHSGSLAIRAAVTGNVNVTYKLLYNDAVAMTGGQSTESGQTTPQIAKQLLGEGVKKVVIVADEPTRYANVALEPSVRVYPREELDSVQRRLRETKGVTVLIYDQMCATEKRRRIKRKLLKATSTRAYINPAVCEGCGDCSKQSNCLSIHPLETDFGTKRQIDQSSCNQDTRCVDGFCPSFVTIEGSHNAKRERARPTFDATNIPLPEPMSLDRPRSIVFTGVGGTGVTTVSAIVGMAAHVDGKASSTLDMTGLAQKGGQVLSHVRIANQPQDIRSGRVPPASADVMIAGDLIVATNLDGLNLVCKETTRAVANFDIQPTSEFIHNRTRGYRGQPKVDLFAQAVRELGVIHAEGLAEEYLYDALYSNMILLGFAWQRGLVPVSLRGLYRAIKLNGVAIDENVLAFDLGRLAAYDPARLKEMVPVREPPPEKSLDDLIAHRIAHLTAYQNQSYAQIYADAVAQVRKAETQASLGTVLTRAVAVNLAKVMTYKDEYEVARLYADPAYMEGLNATLGGRKSLKIWLAPPFLAAKDEATGLPKKQAFGAWILGAFKILQHGKVLRGTAFDIFGKTEERAKERALRDQYFADLPVWLQSLSASTHRQIVELANLPDDVRGFGHVKEASLVRTEAKRKTLLAQLTQRLAPRVDAH